MHVQSHIKVLNNSSEPITVKWNEAIHGEVNSSLQTRAQSLKIDDEVVGRATRADVQDTVQEAKRSSQRELCN